MTRPSLLLLVSIVFFVGQVSMAQTFHSIYIFSGPDGQSPSGTLASDQGGNMYGSTQIGGFYRLGNVYKLSQRNAQWMLTPLRSFGGQNFDPAYPSAVIRDASGVLYGASNAGGSTGGGTLFTLRPSARPPASVISPWNETTLYTFLTNDPDGYRPGSGSLVRYQHGNLFGTTTVSNTTCGCGVVYEASPSGNGWTETILYAFSGGTNDGAGPQAGVVMDAAGDLFGTTAAGGAENCGVVYRLAHPAPAIPRASSIASRKPLRVVRPGRGSPWTLGAIFMELRPRVARNTAVLYSRWRHRMVAGRTTFSTLSPERQVRMPI
jgi:uncharacterized repeat protein (TIGR03803 family)